MRSALPTLAVTAAATLVLAAGCAAPTAMPLPPPTVAAALPPSPPPAAPTAALLEPATPVPATAPAPATTGSGAGGSALTVPTAESLKDWFQISRQPFPSGPGAQVGQSYPYELYTHCGIEFEGFSGRWWQAETPLSDGHGNPPAGWGDPKQAGTMTLVAPDEAVFRAEGLPELRFHLSEVEPPPCHS
jgi:hypothetical protein